MLSGSKGKASIDWSKCNMAYVNHRCVKLDDETSTHYKALPLFLLTLLLEEPSYFYYFHRKYIAIMK